MCCRYLHIYAAIGDVERKTDKGHVCMHAHTHFPGPCTSLAVEAHLIDLGDVRGIVTQKVTDVWGNVTQEIKDSKGVWYK